MISTKQKAIAMGALAIVALLVLGGLAGYGSELLIELMAWRFFKAINWLGW